MSDLQPGVNTDLLTPADALGLPRVPSLTAMTAAFPVIAAKAPKYYVCTMKAASMHRPDGKRITFVQGFFKAEQVYDQRYLDHEIINGGASTYIREATPEEVYQYKLRTNLRGTIEEDIKPEIESRVKADLTARIIAAVKDSSNSGKSMDQILAELESGDLLPQGADIEQQKQDPKQLVVTDEQKIAGVSSTTDALARLKAAREKTGTSASGAVVLNTTENAMGKMSGIVSTKDINAGAAASGGQSDGGASNAGGSV